MVTPARAALPALPSDTTGVLYKHEHVTNNLACVLRTFQDTVD